MTTPQAMIQTSANDAMRTEHNAMSCIDQVDQFGLELDAGRSSNVSLGSLLGSIPSDVRLISFDVFDTVVTRRSGFPEAEFLFIGQRLSERGLIRCSAVSFAHTRYICEKRARCNKPGREITLREIYEEVVCFTNSESMLEQMIQVELETEAESIKVVPAMLSVVREARERYGRVVFISDMYLPEAFLEDRLREHGLFRDDDRLYVSSSYGVQKGDGRLFETVLAHESILPNEMFHVGNSRIYDIAPAKKLGIPHHLFDQGNPHPSEEVLNALSMYTDGESALLAGAARRARLEAIDLNGHEKAIWDTGASVTGPLVWMYAQWVVEQARYRGIDQLYFLARDAYPVYLAVKAILEDRPDIHLSTHYIYGSRPTYYALGIKKLSEKEWGVLTSHGGHRYETLEAICKGLMVRADTLKMHLEGAGLSDVLWNQRLTGAQLNSLQNHALYDASFNQDLLRDILDYQQLQRRYFEEQGFAPGKGVALIDSGWTSRSHAPLYKFLKKMGCENLRLFYMGLLVEKPYIPLNAIDTFMFNRATKQGVISHRMIYTRSLETLFTSFHGRTTGFAEREGRVHPILAEVEDQVFINRYTGLYISGFRSFLHQIRPMSKSFDAVHNTRDVAEQVLYRFWRKPTRDEAKVWSKLTWEWDPLGQIRHSLSRSYRISDCVHAFVQNKTPMLYPQFWVAAAKQISPKHVLFIIYISVYLRRQLDRLWMCVPYAIRNPLNTLRRKIWTFTHHK